MPGRRVRSKDLDTSSTNRRIQGRSSVGRSAIVDGSVGDRELGAGAVKDRHYAPRGTDQRHVNPRILHPQPDVPWSLAGEVYEVEWPPWSTRRSTEIIEIAGLLGTAGTTDTVIELRRNGTAAGELTIVADETEGAEPLHVALTGAPSILASDRVTIAVTTAGTGAEDLTVIMRFAS